MTENATTTAPLTRREAREIERRTGRRIAAGSVAPVSLMLEPAPDTVAAPMFVHDTAEIERNAETSMVSVFPTEVIGRVADTLVEPESKVADDLMGSAFARPVSIRAARPASLVARARRRTALGLGVAASAAVLATAAIAVPGAVGQGQGQDSAMASLVRSNDVAGDNAGQSNDATTEATGTSTDLVAAPEAIADRAQFAVTAFEPGAVDEAVVAPAPAETGSSDSGSTNGSSSNDSGSGSTGGSTSGGSSYGGDLSGVAGIAQSMMGGGQGWACTDFTAAVYAQMGITLSGGVSSQAAGGTQTSNPQVGDLVVFSGHIGIYAGNGMMWDNPGYPSQFAGWQNTYRAISVMGETPYYVTYR